jgi:photosystem II stability/assembly factor-like uncharacterized protein
MKNNSIFKNLAWENIGPYFVGGRITDIESGLNKNTYYIASASGGVWATRDNAKTWKPIFENESSLSIGDIAVSGSNKNLIWVGTGEQNSSRSSYAGTGVFLSKNGGKSWTHMGLAETHHISRIIIDPEDNKTVYVAALGHLYTPNQERGLYKTTDEGKTWQKIFFVSPKTGIIDLVMHPQNNQILYLASWHKDRKAWNFVEGGRESSIYKSIDAGKTWKRVVKGFPQNRYVGRIGLAISRSNPDVLYALLDNQKPRSAKEKRIKQKKSSLSIEMIEKMSQEDFIKLDNAKLTLFLKENNAPLLYDADIVKGFVRSGQISPLEIANMLYAAYDRQLNPQIIGAEVYCSRNRGESWKKVNLKNLNTMFLTYGFYFGQIRISPDNENEIYILGIPVLKSVDGGKSFRDISSQGGISGSNYVHKDSHAMWIDPSDPNRILLGNDGGLNISQNRGESWYRVTNLSISQCYTINHDRQSPYNIYIGLQDNGVLQGNRSSDLEDSRYKWKMIWGGDGAFVDVEPETPHLVYVESQFGTIYRLNFKTNKRFNIQPKAEKGSPYRFNWLAPFMISRFDSSTIYLGANRLLKSMDRGESWTEISADLSDKKNINGNVPFGTITALDESWFSAQVIYAGTDDGNIWMTRVGGKKWKQIGNILPKKWVSRIIASRYQKDRLYVSLTGYREDDFNTYVYMTENQGLDWESLQANLPAEPVNVIREDPENEHILYLGTDLGVYVSLDMGENWYSLKNNLPTVPVYDLRIHPITKELMIATHGRGVYLLSVKDIQAHASAEY